MPKKTKRDEELSTRRKINDRCIEIFHEVEQGFADQRERTNDALNYWDMWNCTLNEKQFYNGNSQIYVPIVQDAIKARRTRFTNQIFPQSGRYVEVTTENGDVPFATMSLIEHYVRKAKLRTQVIPALIVNGDIEGQYTVYVGWQTRKRHVVSRETKPVEVQGHEFPELGEVEKIKRETIEEGYPCVEAIHDSDLLVLPSTAGTPEDAIEMGGSVTVIRRWTKAKIRQMIDDGEFDEDAGEAFIKNLTKKEGDGKQDIAKRQADAAGIRTANSGKYAVGYETWMKLKVDGELRICRAYYGGDDQVLGCKLNPYWCDEIPIISGPVDKVSGVFKGKSPVSGGVHDLQIFANDICNEGADTAHFSAMPIIMTDPEKNPNIGSMILSLAAIWQTDPKSTSFATLPPIWEKALDLVNQVKNQVFQSLGVNPSMIPQSTGQKQKRNQAEIANEQQVDILTTADAVTNIEDTILTPLVQRIIAYDMQYREKEIMVRSFGEMGRRASMEAVDPLVMGNAFEFRWYGVESARNAAMIQQQISSIGVVQKIPPQMYQGYRIDLAPVITQIFEGLFGPRLAPLVFKSLKDEMSVDPELENSILEQGMEMPTHAMDDDQEHLQVHMQLAQADPNGVVKAHMMKHQQQLQQKQQAQMMAQQQQQQGGGGGQGGRSRPGANVRGPAAGRRPAGAIHPDQMARAGAPQMPRRNA